MSSDIRRLPEIMLATLGLVLLAPLLAALSLIVYLSVGRPILINEAWTDHRGVTTEVLVFRSGTLTFLRRTSLDKLPRLMCVLMGDCGIDALLS